MKVLFINDSTSNPNWGDRAAAISLRAMISARGGQIVHAVSELDLVLASFGERPVPQELAGKRRAREVATALAPPALAQIKRKIGQRSASSRESRLIPRAWKDFEPSARRVLDKKGVWPDFWRTIQDIDVAVIHGDGAMVGNGAHPRTILFLSYLIKKHFDKPVIIVNHTADFDQPDLREMAQHVYPLFDDVVFRDPVSAERCKTFCAGRFAPDTTFWFEPVDPEAWVPLARRMTYFDVWPDTARFDPAQPYLCLGGSSIFATLGQRNALADEYRRLVEHLQSVYSGQIVLTVSDIVDQGIFRPLAEQLKLPLIGLTTPVQLVADVLGNADAYIGGRWHPSIFALRGGAPILPLSAKTFKMRALTDMAGLPVTAFDALHPERDQQAIGRQLLSYVERRNELRASLRDWAEEMAADSWNNVAYLDRGQLH